MRNNTKKKKESSTKRPFYAETEDGKIREEEQKHPGKDMDNNDDINFLIPCHSLAYFSSFLIFCNSDSEKFTSFAYPHSLHIFRVAFNVVFYINAAKKNMNEFPTKTLEKNVISRASCLFFSFESNARIRIRASWFILFFIVVGCSVKMACLTCTNIAFNSP